MNVLEAKDLSFAYGNTPVLDAASFTMCEGGFAALVGVNGAGKSTLLRLLLGELKPTGGHIALMGQDIGSFKSWQRIGYVPQDGLTRKASFPASVNEVVLANLYSRIGLFRFPRREHREDVRRTLELVGMQVAVCWASFPAGSASACSWHRRLSAARRCCCWMSPPQDWMRRAQQIFIHC